MSGQVISSCPSTEKKEKVEETKCNFTKSKNWMFVDFGYKTTTNVNEFANSNKYNEWKEGYRHLVYAVYQLEAAPSTGNLHIQGYLHLREKHDKFYLIKHYSETASFKPCRGDEFDNTKYCTKDETRILGPVKIGDINNITNQGERNDLTEIVKSMCSKKSLNTLVDTYGDKLIKNYRGLKEIVNELQIEEKTQNERELEVVWFYGPPGTGKSKYALTLFPNAYRKNCSKWWCGYKYENEVIFDDWNEIPYEIGKDELLKWLDKYKYIVQTKGGRASLCYTKVIITSNNHPKIVFHNHENLLRRIHAVYKFKKDFTFEKEDINLKQEMLR